VLIPRPRRGRRRGNGAKEAVLFAVDAGGEKQCIRRPGVRVIAKGKGPESIDGQDGIVGVLHEAHEFVGEAVECGDAARCRNCQRE